MEPWHDVEDGYVRYGRDRPEQKPACFVPNALYKTIDTNQIPFDARKTSALKRLHLAPLHTQVAWGFGEMRCAQPLGTGKAAPKGVGARRE